MFPIVAFSCPCPKKRNKQEKWPQTVTRNYIYKWHKDIGMAFGFILKCHQILAIFYTSWSTHDALQPSYCIVLSSFWFTKRMRVRLPKSCIFPLSCKVSQHVFLISKYPGKHIAGCPYKGLCRRVVLRVWTVWVMGLMPLFNTIALKWLCDSKR